MVEAKSFRLKVVATKIGYYNHQRRYPDGIGHPRGGEVFIIKGDALRIDEKGNVLLDKDGSPVLPKWVKPFEILKPKISLKSESNGKEDPTKSDEIKEPEEKESEEKEKEL